jgi:hypothetical protein
MSVLIWISRAIPDKRRILTVRYWLPLLAALVCLVFATKVGPIVSFILIIAAFGLVIEVSTKAFEQAGRGGRLTDHKQ